MAETHQYPEVNTKVFYLPWAEDMTTRIVKLRYPKEILTVDSWFSPQPGELCFNSDREIDVVKSIQLVRAKDPFKAYNRYTFENKEGSCSESMVYRLEVKKGKSFVFNGKTFVYQKYVTGDVIDKIAKENM